MTARQVTRSLRVFTAERAPIGVTLGLALALCAGPWALVRANGPALPRSVAIVFFLLVALRIADDLHSLGHDRTASPTRALPSGRISPRAITVGAVVLFVAALLLGLPRASLALGLLASYYAGYYALADRIPVVLRPPLVNAVFAAIPAMVGLVNGAIRLPSLAMLGLFFWLSAVGHDYAHEVHALGEAPVGEVTCSTVLGPRRTTALGLLCYMGALLAAVSVARDAAGDRPVLFVASLVALFGYVAYLLARLIARPSRAAARRLYVNGFACCAAPSLLLGIDRLLGW